MHYSGLTQTINILSEVSNAFEEDVNFLTAKATQKRDFDASVEFGSEEVHDVNEHVTYDENANVNLEPEEAALLSMTLFQQNVTECAISAQRKAAYDLALVRVLSVEDGITETLDDLRDDGKVFKIEKRPTVQATEPKTTAKVQTSEISADFRMISGCEVSFKSNSRV